MVRSCFGHIRDLEKTNFGIDFENNYEPKYVVSADKEALVKELKKLAKGADEILLATDEDREGEAISWHLSCLLYTSDAADERSSVDFGGRRIIKKKNKVTKDLDMSNIDKTRGR